MIAPQPWVEMDARRIYCKADRLDQGVTVLDGLSIDWGQAHAMEARRASTVRFQLWDADGFWLRRAAVDAWNAVAASPVIGIEVVLGWTVGATTRIMFRGTVSNMDIQRSERKVSKFTSAHGWDITVTATDRTTQLGESTVQNATTWPAESAIARANRINDAIAAAGVDIDAVYFEPDTVTWPMGLTKIEDKTILQLITDFYDSFGILWDYRPDENVIRPTAIEGSIRSQVFYRRPGTLDHLMCAEPTTLAGFGEDTADYYSTPLRACDLTANGSQVAIDRTARINAINLAYLRADGSDWRTAVYPGPGIKLRQADYSTWLNLDSPNRDNSARVWAHSWERMRATNWPSHPPVTFDTTLTGGFESIEQAFTLTRACQSWATVTVLGSPYSAAIGRLGEAQIIGGTVRYQDSQWIIDMNLSWSGGYSYGGDKHSWASVRDRNAVWPTLTWNDPTVGRLDHTVTWSDIRHTALTPAIQPLPAQEVP